MANSLRTHPCSAASRCSTVPRLRLLADRAPGTGPRNSTLIQNRGAPSRLGMSETPPVRSRRPRSAGAEMRRIQPGTGPQKSLYRCP
eukprot:CAMPEP_0179026504 /NCGR_PEP_ID=MMETSP0796-20121207/8546_1 /TAXON_ID=73915 /ORGANISM="Pyrodinium bahamense, Strain pbaha01" /LENGTH=86 /DNA_ID=CAMNT_0020722581 /DNA_START=170 /DNA_END=430 /DNA_ORIENTATION=+